MGTNGNGGNVEAIDNWLEPTTANRNDLVVKKFSTNVTVDSNIIVSHPEPQG